MNKIKVLIEGEGSEKQFWDNLNNYMNNIFEIITYKGITKLNKFFFTAQYNTHDLFIVSMDKVMDNRRIINYVLDFSKKTINYNNVYILDLTCFEDTLLSFTYITNWIYSVFRRNNDNNDNNVKDRINTYIEYVNDGANWKSNNLLIACMKRRYPLGLQNKSIENLADTVLREITKSTPFYTDKGTLGACFYNDCYNKTQCYYYTKPGLSRIPKHELCGLWTNRKTFLKKISILYRYTKLYATLQNCKKFFISKGFLQASSIK